MDVDTGGRVRGVNKVKENIPKPLKVLSNFNNSVGCLGRAWRHRSAPYAVATSERLDTTFAPPPSLFFFFFFFFFFFWCWGRYINGACSGCRKSDQLNAGEEAQDKTGAAGVGASLSFGLLYGLCFWVIYFLPRSSPALPVASRQSLRHVMACNNVLEGLLFLFVFS